MEALNKVLVRHIAKQSGDLWKVLSKMLKMAWKKDHIEGGLTRNKNNLGVIQDQDKKFTIIKEVREWIKKGYIKIIDQKDNAHVI